MQTYMLDVEWKNTEVHWNNFAIMCDKVLFSFFKQTTVSSWNCYKKDALIGPEPQKNTEKVP